MLFDARRFAATVSAAVMVGCFWTGSSMCAIGQGRGSETEHITVDARAATTPFPHFWEETFGSGRAILALRESYRQDLRTVKAATGFQSIRFHGIFDDEVGLYDPDRRSIESPRPPATPAQLSTTPSTTSLMSMRFTMGCWPTVWSLILR